MAVNSFGIRFQAVAVPQGTTIDVAYISCYTNTVDDPEGTIYGNDVDDANDFNDEADVLGRTMTTASVGWSDVNLGTGAWTNTPELKTIVQEIVNRGGWVSGQDMAFIFEATPDSKTYNCRSYDYDDNTKGPKLHVEYTITHLGAATLAGVGTLAGIAYVTFIGASTLSGVGTLVAKGVGTFIGAATLSGTGTLAALGGFWQYGIATLSGAGALSAIGRIAIRGIVALAGVGTLVTKGTNYCGIGVNLTLQKRPLSLTLQERPTSLTLQKRPTDLTLPEGD